MSPSSFRVCWNSSTRPQSRALGTYTVANPLHSTPSAVRLTRCQLPELYGFIRDELRCILDSADIMDENYPSEIFRVLKKNAECEFTEYRT